MAKGSFATFIDKFGKLQRADIIKLRNEACHEHFLATVPKGRANEARIRIERAIEDEVKRVVVGVEDGFGRFIASPYGMNTKRALDDTVTWSAEDGRLKELKFSKLALDAGQQEIQAWHERQRNRRGRVPWRKYQEVMVVSKRAARIYMERKKAMAGLAKAGWIGPNVNGGWASPKWVRKHERRVTVRVMEYKTRDGGCEFVVTNPIRYVNMLLSRQGSAKAGRKAESKVVRKWLRECTKLARDFSNNP